VAESQRLEKYFFRRCGQNTSCDSCHRKCLFTNKVKRESEVSFRSAIVNPSGIKLYTAGKVNWTKTELFRLTFAEQITESKIRTQRNAQRKFSLSNWLSPNQKRHFTFWIKFGLSLKFGLSERLIKKVKAPTVSLSPPTSSSLRITDRSFWYASPCLWNQLPSSLRQPHISPSVSALPVHAPTTSSHSVNSPLSPSITPSLFHSRLKTQVFPTIDSLPGLRTDSMDFMTGPFRLSILVF